MTVAACSEEEFIKLWNDVQSPAEMARILNVAIRMIYKRRNTIEKKHSIILPVFDKRSPTFNVVYPNNGVRATAELDNGVIIVGSDCHYWPGIVSTAHKAFVHLAKELSPKMIVLNGDVFDGSSISRHDPQGWATTPTVKQELDACIERLTEIENVAANAKLHWTWGNHDMRFNTRLAAQVGSAWQGIQGMNLSDHFPRWKFSTSLMVNENTMIKHNYHNGIHAAYNNTLKSGISIVTGHLHSLKVTPWTDYKGDRYGVDTGTLASIDEDSFRYALDSPKNWRSGFAVLTFNEGELLPPELCQVLDEAKGKCYFRGSIFYV